MNQSKGTKQIKVLNLSRLDGIYELSLGTSSTSERPSRNRAKSEYPQRHPENPVYDDVVARHKRWGLM